MSDYLRKYVGQYRVKSDYDLNTNDYIKDDNDFDGLYIDCYHNIKIRHSNGSILYAYIPSKSRGMNILRQIWIDKVNDKLPTETTTTRKYLENLCDKLMEGDILYDAEVLDYEVYFMFNAKDIDYYAKLLKVKTSGCNISPYSIKNLPKDTYKIPDKDMEIYQNIIKDFPKRKMGNKKILDGLLIKKINKDFLEKNKLINNTRMKNKEFIHKKGLWNKYIEYLKGLGYKK